uniref:Uncharacterized protein n=1 Tax=Rhabditophanes sp. KR3021 TaxID=114890 RepID=A0AC35TUN0_9BILA
MFQPRILMNNYFNQGGWATNGGGYPYNRPGSEFRGLGVGIGKGIGRGAGLGARNIGRNMNNNEMLFGRNNPMDSYSSSHSSSSPDGGSSFSSSSWSDENGNFQSSYSSS